MVQYINKASVMEEIERRIKKYATIDVCDCKELEAIYGAKCKALTEILSFLNTLEVKDPYEQCVQYDSIKTGIQAHAETYSFNIESKLFNQLTKEQQELWREEIEQACISGGEAGVELVRDIRYKENVKVEEVDLFTELGNYIEHYRNRETGYTLLGIAEHFYELGLNANKGIKV